MEEIMNENKFEVADQKVSVKDRIAGFVDNAKDFIEDHEEGIFMTIIGGGCAIIIGQSIHYMHLLNKAAKNGKFFGCTR